MFLDSKYQLSPEEEAKRYLLHENSLEDPRYRKFLQPFAEAVLERVRPGCSGLDYGCGPGPLLAQMLQESRLQVSLFDPLFFPNEIVLTSKYDLITASEVVEHFRYPQEEFQKLFGLLKPGGWLAVMTECLESGRSFGDWHYHRDPTHICFYDQKTFQFIQTQLGFKRLELISPRICLFQK